MAKKEVTESVETTRERMRVAYEKLAADCGDALPEYIFGVMMDIQILRGFVSDVEDVAFFKPGRKLSHIQVVEFLQRRLKKLQKDLGIDIDNQKEKGNADT